LDNVTPSRRVGRFAPGISTSFTPAVEPHVRYLAANPGARPGLVAAPIAPWGRFARSNYSLQAVTIKPAGRRL